MGKYEHEKWMYADAEPQAAAGKRETDSAKDLDME
jgi:hypothetical protein